MFSRHLPLHAGQDPRAWSEYMQLCDELSKLTHPARPDVDWKAVEQLCVTLFRHNGTDLQTAAWFCCARLQRSGLAGLSEGLELIDSLITHQWSVMWPPQIPVRKDILVWLSEHLMLSLRLRRFTLSHQDLQTVYRLEQQVRHLCDLLQRLVLRQVSKMDALLHWMHTAVVRLENMRDAPLPEPVESSYHHTTAPLPVALSPSEQDAIIEGNAAALQAQGRVITERTRRQLDELAQLSPSWAQDYGFVLVAQTQRLWPHQPDIAALAKQWQQQMDTNALPEPELQGWHQAMEQLQLLTNKLNSTDMQRGKYLTVSELKSSVFAITQTLSQSVPQEEQLRRLSRQKKETGIRTAAEQHLRQLENRYALIIHSESAVE